MKKATLFIFFISLLVSEVAISAESDEEKNSFELNPVVIDSKNGTGATVGVEYKIKGTLLSKALGSKDTTATINPNVTIWLTTIGYDSKGTVAISKDRNPKNFLKFLLNAKLLYSSPKAGIVKGGGYFQYETDQDFSNKQFVYDLGITYVKVSALLKNDSVSIDAHYGQVNPENDSERKAALDTTTLDSYYRWNLEFLYKCPLPWKTVRAVEFNYRCFLENNAPAAIKNSGLDKHELTTLFVRLKNDLFIAYSTGKLPFDRKNDKMFLIGFSFDKVL